MMDRPLKITTKPRERRGWKKHYKAFRRMAVVLPCSRFLTLEDIGRPKGIYKLSRVDADSLLTQICW